MEAIQLNLFSVTDNKSLVRTVDRRCKLTPEDVREIKAKLRQQVSQYSLAKRYKVSVPNISYIASGKIWADIN